MVIDERQFTDLLKTHTGEDWESCLEIFQKYGTNLSFDVTNVLLHAAEQGKLKEVLEILANHFESHLKYQHPEIRGRVANRLLGVNPTQSMFIRICETTLNLKPNP